VLGLGKGEKWDWWKEKNVGMGDNSIRAQYVYNREIEIGLEDREKKWEKIDKDSNN
jgi:hypothetical protein